tara:strand:+ start:130 stop:474 length:345 start_codon:yes stop_codon:yes gene_type:complete
MKNLIIALFITLASFTAKAQEQFNGMWQSEGTTYITTILASRYKILQIQNTSFAECKILNETILQQTVKTITTHIENEDNGYYAEIEYVMQNDGTILSSYSTRPGQYYLLTKIH